MDDADRKRIAELNAQADNSADLLLDAMKASPYTPWVILGWTLACVAFGWWMG